MASEAYISELISATRKEGKDREFLSEPLNKEFDVLPLEEMKKVEINKVEPTTDKTLETIDYMGETENMHVAPNIKVDTVNDVTKGDDGTVEGDIFLETSSVRKLSTEEASSVQKDYETAKIQSLPERELPENEILREEKLKDQRVGIIATMDINDQVRNVNDGTNMAHEDEDTVNQIINKEHSVTDHSPQTVGEETSNCCQEDETKEEIPIPEKGEELETISGGQDIREHVQVEDRDQDLASTREETITESLKENEMREKVPTEEEHEILQKADGGKDTGIQIIEWDGTAMNNFATFAGEKTCEDSCEKKEDKEPNIEVSENTDDVQDQQPLSKKGYFNETFEEKLVHESTQEIEAREKYKSAQTNTGTENETIAKNANSNLPAATQLEETLKEEERNEMELKEEVKYSDTEHTDCPAEETKTETLKDGENSNQSCHTQGPMGTLNETPPKNTNEDLVENSSVPDVYEEEIEEEIVEKAELPVMGVVQETIIDESKHAEPSDLGDSKNIHILKADEDGEETVHEAQNENCDTLPNSKDEQEVSAGEAPSDYISEQKPEASIIESEDVELPEGRKTSEVVDRSDTVKLVTSEEHKSASTELDKEQLEDKEPINDTSDEVDAGGQSHEIADSETRNTSTITEENPISIQPCEQSGCDSESVVEDQSIQTITETNKIKIDEDQDHVKERSLEPAGENITGQEFQVGHREMKEEVEPRFEEENHINKTKDGIETIKDDILEEESQQNSSVPQVSEKIEEEILEQSETIVTEVREETSLEEVDIEDKLQVDSADLAMEWKGLTIGAHETGSDDVDNKDKLEEARDLVETNMQIQTAEKDGEDGTGEYGTDVEVKITEKDDTATDKFAASAGEETKEESPCEMNEDKEPDMEAREEHKSAQANLETEDKNIEESANTNPPLTVLEKSNDENSEEEERDLLESKEEVKNSAKEHTGQTFGSTCPTEETKLEALDDEKTENQDFHTQGPTGTSCDTHPNEDRVENSSVPDVYEKETEEEILEKAESTVTGVIEETSIDESKDEEPQEGIETIEIVDKLETSKEEKTSTEMEREKMEDEKPVNDTSNEADNTTTYTEKSILEQEFSAANFKDSVKEDSEPEKVVEVETGVHANEFDISETKSMSTVTEENPESIQPHEHSVIEDQSNKIDPETNEIKVEEGMDGVRDQKIKSIGENMAGQKFQVEHTEMNEEVKPNALQDFGNNVDIIDKLAEASDLGENNNIQIPTAAKDGEDEAGENRQHEEIIAESSKEEEKMAELPKQEVHQILERAEGGADVRIQIIEQDDTATKDFSASAGEETKGESSCGKNEDKEPDTEEREEHRSAQATLETEDKNIEESANTNPPITVLEKSNEENSEEEERDLLESKEEVKNSAQEYTGHTFDSTCPTEETKLEALDDEKMENQDFQTQSPTGTSCDTHPNVDRVENSSVPDVYEKETEEEILEKAESTVTGVSIDESKDEEPQEGIETIKVVDKLETSKEEKTTSTQMGREKMEDENPVNDTSNEADNTSTYTEKAILEQEFSAANFKDSIKEDSELEKVVEVETGVHTNEFDISETKSTSTVTEGSPESIQPHEHSVIEDQSNKIDPETNEIKVEEGTDGVRDQKMKSTGENIAGQEFQVEHTEMNEEVKPIALQDSGDNLNIIDKLAEASDLGENNNIQIPTAAKDEEDEAGENSQHEEIIAESSKEEEKMAEVPKQEVHQVLERAEGGTDVRIQIIEQDDTAAEDFSASAGEETKGESSCGKNEDKEPDIEKVPETTNEVQSTIAQITKETGSDKDCSTETFEGKTNQKTSQEDEAREEFKGAPENLETENQNIDENINADLPSSTGQEKSIEENLKEVESDIMESKEEVKISDTEQRERSFDNTCPTEETIAETLIDEINPNQESYTQGPTETPNDTPPNKTNDYLVENTSVPDVCEKVEEEILRKQVSTITWLTEETSINDSEDVEYPQVIKTNEVVDKLDASKEERSPISELKKAQLEDEKPVNGASNEACNASTDNEKVTLEPERSGRNISLKEEVDVEKSVVEVEAAGHSHEIEVSETKSTSTIGEENPKSIDPCVQPSCEPESVVEDQSIQTLPETDSVKIDEGNNSVKDRNLESAGKNVTAQEFQGHREMNEEVEPKFDDDSKTQDGIETLNDDIVAKVCPENTSVPQLSEKTEEEILEKAETEVTGVREETSLKECEREDKLQLDGTDLAAEGTGLITIGTHEIGSDDVDTVAKLEDEREVSTAETPRDYISEENLDVSSTLSSRDPNLTATEVGETKDENLENIEASYVNTDFILAAETTEEKLLQIQESTNARDEAHMVSTDIERDDENEKNIQGQSLASTGEETIAESIKEDAAELHKQEVHTIPQRAVGDREIGTETVEQDGTASDYFASAGEETKEESFCGKNEGKEPDTEVPETNTEVHDTIVPITKETGNDKDFSQESYEEKTFQESSQEDEAREEYKSDRANTETGNENIEESTNTNLPFSAILEKLIFKNLKEEESYVKEPNDVDIRDQHAEESSLSENKNTQILTATTDVADEAAEKTVDETQNKNQLDSSSKCKDEREVSTREMSPDYISEQNVEESSTEHNLMATEESETTEDTPEKVEASYVNTNFPLSAEITEKKISQREGESLVHDEEQKVHMIPVRNTETNIIEAEDVELPEIINTREVADCSDIGKMETPEEKLPSTELLKDKLEDEKPVNEASNEDNMCTDTENAILEQEFSAGNSKISSKEDAEIEKAVDEVEAGGHGHEIEDSKTKSASTIIEENLEPEPHEQPRCEEQSNKTRPETDDSKIDDGTSSVKDPNLEFIGKNITGQEFQVGDREMNEEGGPKLEAENQICAIQGGAEPIKDDILEEVSQENSSAPLVSEKTEEEFLEKAETIVTGVSEQTNLNEFERSDEAGEKTVHEEHNGTHNSLQNNEDEREVSTAETTRGCTLEENLEKSSTPSSREDNLKETEAGETTDGTLENVEASYIKTDFSLAEETTEKKLLHNHDESTDPTDEAENEEAHDKDQELCKALALNDNISITESQDVEFQKCINTIEEASCSDTGKLEKEKSEVKEPITDASNEACNTLTDRTEAILEQEYSAGNVKSCLKEEVEIEKAVVEVEAEGHTHETETSATTSTSTTAEKNPASVEPHEQLSCATESDAEHQSNKTFPETNKIEIEECSTNVKDMNLDTTGKDVIKEDFQDCQKEMNEGEKPNLEAENQIKEVQDRIEAVKDVILAEEVSREEVQTAEGSENKEQVIKEESCTVEHKMKSASNDIADMMTDPDPVPIESIEATDSCEITETVESQAAKDLNLGSESSFTIKAPEEDMKKDIEKPINVTRSVLEVSEQKTDETDSCDDNKDIAPPVTEVTVPEKVQLDDESISYFATTSEDKSLAIETTHRSLQGEEVDSVKREETSGTVSQLTPTVCANVNKETVRVENPYKFEEPIGSDAASKSKEKDLEGIHETEKKLHMDQTDRDILEEEINDVTEIISENDYPGVESVILGDKISNQTRTSEDLTEKLQEPSCAMLSREQGHETTSEIEKIKEESTSRDETLVTKIFEGYFDTSDREETRLQKEYPSEVKDSKLELGLIQDKHDVNPDESPKEEGIYLEDTSVEPQENVSKINFADSASEMKQDLIDSTIESRADENQNGKDSNDTIETVKNEISSEKATEKEVAKNSQVGSQDKETIRKNYQEDVLEAVGYPGEKTTQELEPTKNAAQNEELSEELKRSSEDDNTKKQVMGEERAVEVPYEVSVEDETVNENLPQNVEGKNVKEAPISSGIQKGSDETNCRDTDTEATALSEEVDSTELELVKHDKDIAGAMYEENITRNDVQNTSIEDSKVADVAKESGHEEVKEVIEHNHEEPIHETVEAHDVKKDIAKEDTSSSESLKGDEKPKHTPLESAFDKSDVTEDLDLKEQEVCANEAVTLAPVESLQKETGEKENEYENTLEAKQRDFISDKQVTDEATVKEVKHIKDEEPIEFSTREMNMKQDEAEIHSKITANEGGVTQAQNETINASSHTNKAGMDIMDGTEDLPTASGIIQDMQTLAKTTASGITQDMQKLAKHSLPFSEKQVLVEPNSNDSTITMGSTGDKDFPLVQQDPKAKPFEAEVEDLNFGNTSEAKPEANKELQADKVETAEVKEVKQDKDEDEDEEGDENKKVDSGSDAPVMVEASRDLDVKVVSHKKSHSILSGVGSKVKHSIAKVKKVITGKSSQCSHPKPSSPK